MGHNIVIVWFGLAAKVLSLSPKVMLGVTVPTGSERRKNMTSIGHSGIWVPLLGFK